MGCFSFLCQKTEEPILSDSIGHGDAVHLFLLKNGVVIEYMYGNYSSYGEVYGHSWKMEWDDVVELMHHDKENNGIAAILGPYWKKGDPYPIQRSERDPDQGWGTHETLPANILQHLQDRVESCHAIYY